MLWKRMLCSTIIALSMLSINLASAQTATELLEKGIFQEETAGNLDLAIETYRKIVTNNKELQSVAAQAQFRLAQCLLKQGKKDDATAAFKELVNRYPDQTELVAKAKQQLPADLELVAPPWKSGERLTMLMTLPNGLPIGIVATAVDADSLDGKKIWRMTVRRFVQPSQNEGVSQMLIDQATNLPLRTDWQHTMLGNNSTLWSDKELTITKPAKDGKAGDATVVKLTSPAYSNDQWFFGFRQLPLAIGYKTTIPIRVDFTGGNQIDLEVNVAKKETIQSPAGSFECFRLDTNIQQTFWVSDTPERYPVKFEAGGVAALLQATSGAAEQTLKRATPPISVDVPKGWFHFDTATKNPDTVVGFHLVAPEMVSVQVEVKKKSLLDADSQENPQAWCTKKMARLKDSVKDVKFTTETPQATQVAGQPGAMCTATHSVMDESYVHQISLAMQGDWVMSVYVAGYEPQIKALQPQLKQILASLRMK